MRALPEHLASLFDLEGKVAIVTGASGAFGEMAAQVLGGAGAKLVLASGNAAALEAVATRCRSSALVSTIAKRADSEEAAAAIVACGVEAFGRIDILVVASGTNEVAKIDEMRSDQFDAVMDANVTGSWLMARACVRQMLKQGDGGKIVLLSSARGVLGHPAGYTAYCASKSAVDGLVRALGCELGPHKITANAIAPTVFRSELTSWLFEETERARSARAALMTRLPAGRLGEPSDLAGPLLFLCSAASNFYTGQILHADGGYTAG